MTLRSSVQQLSAFGVTVRPKSGQRLSGSRPPVWPRPGVRGVCVMTLVRGRALGGTIWQAACQVQEGEIAMADRPNILFFHVDNLGTGS
jgi:hypothetical protein